MLVHSLLLAGLHLLLDLGSVLRFLFRSLLASLLSFFPSLSPPTPRALLNLRTKIASKKIPKHVCIAVTGRQGGGTEHAVGRMVAWCWALGIEVVTVWDRHGLLEQSQPQLREEVRSVCTRLSPAASASSSSSSSSSFSSSYAPLASLALPVFLQSPDELRNSTGPATRVLIQHGDGRAAIASHVRRLCSSPSPSPSLSSSSSSSSSSTSSTSPLSSSSSSSHQTSVPTFPATLAEFTESMGAPLADPDVVLRCGGAECLYGCMTWHQRLTEIITMPDLDHITFYDFTHALERFAGCQQRVGT